MNIYMREMKAHRKSLIIWSVALLFMILGGMGKFSAYQASGQDMTKLLSQFPKSVRAVLGMGDFDLTKAIGFFGMLYFYLILMAAIHAAMMGAGIISKEESDKTVEFLMVKPVSRTNVITSKLLATLTNILVFNIVTLIFSIAFVSAYSKGVAVTGDILRLMVGMFIIQLIFMFIGTCIASASRYPRTSASVATGILLFTYILSMITDMNSILGFLKYFTPFKYFDASNILKGRLFDSAFTVLSVLIIGALLFMTYVFYKKRDLKI